MTGIPLERKQIVMTGESPPSRVVLWDINIGGLRGATRWGIQRLEPKRLSQRFTGLRRARAKIPFSAK